MNKLNDLIEAMEALYMSGADAEHDGSEMLELLEGVNYPALLNIISATAETVYVFKLDAQQPYLSRPLVEEKGFFLFEDVKTCGVKNGVFYQHGLELWLLDDMTFLVTSCFSTMVLGKLMSSYRTVKGMFPNACGIDIDYVYLANYLTDLPKLFQKVVVPITEQ